MSRVIAVAVGALCATLALSAPVHAAGPWQRLQRPLHMPELTPASACPVSAIDRRIDWPRINIFGGAGRGRGPVYPGLGAPDGVLTTTYRDGGPWFGSKLFWYVKPSYRGRVLIRGRRLDGPGSLRFGEDRLALELRIRPQQTVPWEGQPPGSRGVPSIVRAHLPGCYGVQIDGTSFSRVVVFKVAEPEPAS